MKKLVTLSSALLLTAGCFAQYSLSFDANGLRKGDYRNMKQIEYVEQSQSGANQLWDFSKSKVIKDFYIEQNEDLNAIATEGYRLSCDEGGEKNTLFEITPNEKRYYGMETKNSTLSLDEPIVDLLFPFSYQDAKTGAYSGTSQAGSSTNYLDGTYITKADAWGTVIMPDGTTYKNVLRVKVDKEYTESFGTSEYKISSIRYQYFAEGARYPIIITVEQEYFPLANACKCGNSKYTAMFMETPAIYKNDAVQENKTKKASVAVSSFNYLASPNPFIDNLQVSFTLNKDAKVVVRILDLTGNTVSKLFSEKLEEGQYAYDFNTSNLGAGTYVLQLSVDGKVYSNKMLKADR